MRRTKRSRRGKKHKHHKIIKWSAIFGGTALLFFFLKFIIFNAAWDAAVQDWSQWRLYLVIGAIIVVILLFITRKVRPIKFFRELFRSNGG